MSDQHDHRKEVPVETSEFDRIDQQTPVAPQDEEREHNWPDDLQPPRSPVSEGDFLEQNVDVLQDDEEY